MSQSPSAPKIPRPKIDNSLRNMEIVPLGDGALILRVADDANPDAVLAMRDRIAAARIVGVTDIAPSYRTIGIFYNVAGAERFDHLLNAIREAASGSGRVLRRAQSVEIPVCYDEEFAPDLGVVADHAALSAEQVVRQHSGATYRVGAIGFAPGFPFLIGLPERLATPRRSTPRTEVPAGSVAIGGAQTGVYPQASPGGWNIIGRTPVRLFDPHREQPALLRAGDTVRFRRVKRDEFERLKS